VETVGSEFLLRDTSRAFQWENRLFKLGTPLAPDYKAHIGRATLALRHPSAPFWIVTGRRIPAAPLPELRQSRLHRPTQVSIFFSDLARGAPFARAGAQRYWESAGSSHPQFSADM